MFPTLNNLTTSTDRVSLQWGVKIPLRDGVRLNATLYLPVRFDQPSPVIFTLTPYVGQTYHDRGVYFASHGSPFLTVDVRGRGNSEGIFKANGNEAKDGYDIIEWLAKQPYCNGKVAMWGGSYGGYVQWAAAKEFPPHLATIVPVAAPFRGVDSPMRNNIFTPYRIQWLTLLGGHTSQDKVFADQPFWNHQFQRWFESGTAFKEIDQMLGLPSPVFQEWLRHPQRDAYWDSYNPTSDQYARLSLPILTITGIYDGNQPGALSHYREHIGNAGGDANHYLIIGPWDHAGTRTPRRQFVGLDVGAASLLDLPQLHREWYAWTMQDGPKPPFLRDKVAYYVMVADEWRYARTLDAVTATHKALYLSSTVNPTDVFHSGSLSEERPTQQSVAQYVYDPRDITLAALESSVDPESRVDHRMLYASVGRRLVYHTAPFVADTEVSGFFKLTVWLSIDRPDTDFFVAIHDVGMDGAAVLLTTDQMRARYRENEREPKLIDTAEPLRYDFQRFMFVSRLIRKGHRLRLVIGPIDSIFSQKNYNSGGAVAEETMQDARSVTVRLIQDEARPSLLQIPLGTTGD